MLNWLRALYVLRLGACSGLYVDCLLGVYLCWLWCLGVMVAHFEFAWVLDVLV